EMKLFGERDEVAKVSQLHAWTPGIRYLLIIDEKIANERNSKMRLNGGYRSPGRRMNMSPRSAALALSAVAIAVSLSVSPALAVELAPGKARTVALFRRESGALEDTINGKRPAAV